MKNEQMVIRCLNCGTKIASRRRGSTIGPSAESAAARWMR